MTADNRLMTHDIVAWHFLATLLQPHGRSVRDCYALGGSRDEAANQIFAIHPQAAIQRETGRPLTLEQLVAALGTDQSLHGETKVYCIQRSDI